MADARANLVWATGCRKLSGARESWDDCLADDAPLCCCRGMATGAKPWQAGSETLSQPPTSESLTLNSALSCELYAISPEINIPLFVPHGILLTPTTQSIVNTSPRTCISGTAHHDYERKAPQKTTAAKQTLIRLRHISNCLHQGIAFLAGSVEPSSPRSILAQTNFRSGNCGRRTVRVPPPRALFFLPPSAATIAALHGSSVSLSAPVSSYSYLPSSSRSSLVAPHRVAHPRHGLDRRHPRRRP